MAGERSYDYECCEFRCCVCQRQSEQCWDCAEEEALVLSGQLDEPAPRRAEGMVRDY